MRQLGLLIAIQSYPLLFPWARLNIHGAVCALCGWREFQLVIYVPAAEHYCIPASLAQLAGLCMEEVGEVSLVSNPAQVLPKQDSLGQPSCYSFAFFLLNPNKEFIVHTQTI